MRTQVLVATIAAIASAMPASAAVVLDQDNIMTVQPGNGAYSSIGNIFDRRQAQIVRAGRTGKLVRIDLQVARLGNTTGPLAIEIFNAATTGDLPTAIGTPAATFTAFPTAFSGGITSIDVSAANFMVAPGQKFAVLLRAETAGSASRYAWLIGDYIDIDLGTIASRDYAGGYNNLFDTFNPTWFRSGLDRGFATYVDTTSSVVPEPASWALLIAGFGVIGASLRRRRVRAAA